MSVNSATLIYCYVLHLTHHFKNTTRHYTVITPPNTSNAFTAGYRSSVIYSEGMRDKVRASLEKRRAMQTESGMCANEMQQSGIYDAG